MYNLYRKRKYWISDSAIDLAVKHQTTNISEYLQHLYSLHIFKKGHVHGDH
jgi:hypothetical protein